MVKKIRNWKKRKIQITTVDPFYNSLWFLKFGNKFLKEGKKHIIEKVLLTVFISLNRRLNKSKLLTDKKHRFFEQVRNPFWWKLYFHKLNFSHSKLKAQTKFLSTPKWFKRFLRNIKKFQSKEKYIKDVSSFTIPNWLRSYITSKRQYNKSYSSSYTQNALSYLYFYLLKNRVLLGFVRVRKSREYKKVPFPLSPRRQLIAALNLCVSSIKSIKNISLSDKIVIELSDQTKQKIYKREKRIKEQVFELVNQRVNVHYRWK